MIRLAGSSYSGSTALGHFLNTGLGVLFGSELYRLLPAYTQFGSQLRYTPCDHCGDHCTVWTHTLRAAISQDPSSSLSTVYDAFFAAQGAAVHVLVDGSKDRRWYESACPLNQACSYVVTVKHPMRLLASFTYNDKLFIPAGHRASLATCAAFLASGADATADFAAQCFARLCTQYAELLNFVSAQPEGVHAVCRTDNRDEVLQLLQGLSALLGVAFDPARMSATPCHALGGNRSVRWQLDAYTSRPAQLVKDRARFAYYKRNAQDFFIQDNKYSVLFGPALRDRLVALPDYVALCRMLGYDESLPP